jgi:polar amino acid transport system permease protein
MVLVALGILLAAPATAQNKGFIITVQSDMFYILGGTQIYVDDTLYGVTDANGVLTINNFPSGTHNLTAVKEKYSNQTVAVELVGGGSYDFTMRDLPPPDMHKDGMTIYVVEANQAKTLVAGAMVYIDGVFVGQTDNNYGEYLSYLPSGTHEVLVYRKGLINSSTMPINFTPGGSYTIVMQSTGKVLAIFDTDLLLSSLSKELARGAINTIKLSVIAFAVGLLIGLIMGLGRVSKNWMFRGISSVYIEGVRGLPLLLQIMFVNYAIPFMYMDITGSVLPTSIYNTFTACVVALAINSGSYMGEIFKAGILAIHKGQMEAARSLGMNYNQAMLFVILPQAFKIVLPALGNEFIALIKDSSISMVISNQELLFWSKQISTETYNQFTPLFAAGIIYVCITVPLGWGVKYLEHRMNASVVKPRDRGAGWLGRGRKKIAGGIGANSNSEGGQK